MSILFHLSEGAKNLTKARLASILSLISIMLTIILLGLFIILALNLNAWIGSFREQIELEVFVQPGASDKQIENISAKLKEIDGIKDIQFISKENAAKRFKEEFGQDIYDVLDFNPLPPSFIIFPQDSARNAKSIEKITADIYNLAAVDEVVYQKLILESVDKYIHLIYAGAVFFGMIITLISVSLIYNTIRLTIWARRDTIYIMRLVGATQGFIRTPFLIEGLFQGLFASVLASAILYYTVEFIKYFAYPFLLFDNYIFIFLIIFGMVMGLISAGMGIAKFLKSV